MSATLDLVGTVTMPTTVDEQIVGQPAIANALAPSQGVSYLVDQPGRVLALDECTAVVAAFKKWGATVGVRWDLAFAQSCHETNVYRFGADVVPAQHNPAGLGTTGGGVQGLSFPDWDTGIAAMVVHLLAWCNRLDLASRIADPPSGLDPRVPLAIAGVNTKGAATTWRSLGGRWAVPGVGYGTAIQRHYDAIMARPAPPPEALASPALGGWRALWGKET